MKNNCVYCRISPELFDVSYVLSDKCKYDFLYKAPVPFYLPDGLYIPEDEHTLLMDAYRNRCFEDGIPIITFPEFLSLLLRPSKTDSGTLTDSVIAFHLSTDYLKVIRDRLHPLTFDFNPQGV